jgi:hypothetical protein
MPPAGIIVVAAALGALLYGGDKAVHGIKKATVAVHRHVTRPIGCSVENGVTLGHKHCAKPAPQAHK